MRTPIFEQVAAENKFKAFPTEYTDRFTPEVASAQGAVLGAQRRTEQILRLIDLIPKPSKQLQTLRLQIQNIEEE